MEFMVVYFGAANGVGHTYWTTRAEAESFDTDMLNLGLTTSGVLEVTI